MLVESRSGLCKQISDYRGQKGEKIAENLHPGLGKIMKYDFNYN